MDADAATFRAALGWGATRLLVLGTKEADGELIEKALAFSEEAANSSQTAAAWNFMVLPCEWIRSEFVWYLLRGVTTDVS